MTEGTGQSVRPFQLVVMVRGGEIVLVRAEGSPRGREGCAAAELEGVGLGLRTSAAARE